ncbi:DEAD/DEAH box helicase family protein [Lutibacter holmesii]|uniref:DEAD/DEAH box helicase family protein n=1 Tax=Lutibacter holmesii TaxID=1137985 RepID=A0ABW3WJK9_9FLAO
MEGVINTDNSSQIVIGEDVNPIIPKINISIEVQLNDIETPLSLDKEYFTEIEVYYSENKPKQNKGIVAHYTLRQVEKRLNNLTKNLKKDNDPALLKGIYNGGTRGVFCEFPAPFLFFDIDVKKNENQHLYDAFTNSKVFEVLKEISVLCWRSKSGYGMAGIFYVRHLANVTKDNTGLHLKAGNVITIAVSKYIKDETGISVKFDSAQSKFRQIRYLTNQEDPSVINENPKQIDIEIEEEEMVSSTGVPHFKHQYYQSVTGSLEDQFNNENNITDTLLNAGFKDLGNNRYKHPSTTSSSTGLVDLDQNIFFNHSTSFSNKSVFNPYSLTKYTEYHNDSNEFNAALKEKGTDIKKPNKDEFDVAKTIIKNATSVTPQVIFEACYPLKYADIQLKHKFINSTCSEISHIKYFQQYLGVKNLSIEYDKSLEINEYVSEQLQAVLDYADQNKRVCLRAETGTGKTTAFLREFPVLRPFMRLLILVPLTVIVNQSKQKNKSLVGLTGESAPRDHTEAKMKSVVMATYEQGAKHLINGNLFEYIVIDEVHNLITTNNYKREVNSNLTQALNNCNSKIIGLTGTPNNLFKALGYKLINVFITDQQKVDVIQRVDNRRGFKIIKQHLNEVKGKSIFRLNNIGVLIDIKKDLVKSEKYKENEILILHSVDKIKKSSDYKYLIEKEAFKDDIKIVLTTSLIDEGLSIDQEGFFDVVFIEDSYNQNPEAVKQFFARFRNINPERKNYHYFKKKKEQNAYYRNLESDYSGTYEVLDRSDYIFNEENFSSYNDIANDQKFYYDNGDVNTYYLSYQTSNRYFEAFNHWEFNTYLEKNFNLNIEVDESYLLDTIDTTLMKSSVKERKTKMYEVWKNHLEAVEHTVYNITSNKKLKSSIEYNGEPRVYIVADFVEENKKTFERLLLKYFRLIELGEDPNEILLDHNKSQIRNGQLINKKLKLIETIAVIENPKTANDKVNRAKIIGFIDDIKRKKQFTKNDLYKSLKKQKFQDISSYKNYILLEIIKKYAGYTFNKKTKIYKIKSTKTLK